MRRTRYLHIKASLESPQNITKGKITKGKITLEWRDTADTTLTND